MDDIREQHYRKAMEVAQAAWDYVNPPEGPPASDQNPDWIRHLEQVGYARLRDAVHRLRRFEYEVMSQEAQTATYPLLAPLPRF